jgi:hypothetical protein
MHARGVSRHKDAATVEVTGNYVPRVTMLVTLGLPSAGILPLTPTFDYLDDARREKLDLFFDSLSLR